MDDRNDQILALSKLIEAGLQYLGEAAVAATELRNQIVGGDQDLDHLEAVAMILGRITGAMNSLDMSDLFEIQELGVSLDDTTPQ